MKIERYEDTLPEFGCNYFAKRKADNGPIMNPSTPKHIDEREGVLTQLKNGESYGD